MRAKQKKQGSLRIFNLDSQGYTIIEVLLFLAISSFMFVVAASAINGKQARAQFQQGTNAANDQIRQTINDVSNGYYPSIEDFKCSATATGSVSFVAGASPLGQNQGCVFTGKIIHFRPDNQDGDTTTDREAKYNVYTVVGRQFKESSTQIPVNLIEALPIIARTANVHLTEKKKFEWGIETTGTTGVTSNGTPIKAIAILKSFVSGDGTGGLSSGAQNVTIIPLPIPGLGSIAGDTETDVDNYFKWLVTNYGTIDANKIAILAHPNILICLSDEATNGSRYGAVSIGGPDSQRLTSSVKLGSKAPVTGC